VMKVMTRFEVVFLQGPAIERTCVEKAGVKEAVGGVEHPDRDEHGEDGREGKTDVISGGDEPDPKRGYRWGIEREEMPEFEGRTVAFGTWSLSWRQRWGYRGWRCESHFFILGAETREVVAMLWRCLP
jgi:hypothetical protein